MEKAGRVSWVLRCSHECACVCESVCVRAVRRTVSASMSSRMVCLLRRRCRRLAWAGLLLEGEGSPSSAAIVVGSRTRMPSAMATLQPKHGDAGDEHQFARLPAADVPLSALRTIMPGSALYVYEGGCADDEGRRVELSADALVVWVGDFVHAGASYEKGNTRLHFYVHSSVAPRVKDETFICSVAEEDEDSSASYEQEEHESDVSEE